MNGNQSGNYWVIGSLGGKKHDCYPPINLRFKGRVVQCAECGQYYLSSTDWLGYFCWKKRSRRWVRRHFRRRRHNRRRER